MKKSDNSEVFRGLLGKKLGMMEVYSEAGRAIAVTVVEVEGNRVSQLKTQETDGYYAVQLCHGERRASRLKKPMKGHLAKAGIPTGRRLVEFLATKDQVEAMELGEDVPVDCIKVGEFVSVSSVTKGRGFSGGIRRHNFASNRASHGNSLAHRKIGSISMAQDPGRVFPGKRMPGQHGNKCRTVSGLQVVRVDLEHGVLLIKGAVPGPKGADLVIRVDSRS